MEGLVLFYLVVCYLVKNVAEDTYHGVKGTTNPRRVAAEQRRKARQKSRTWGALGNYWADLVEDATAQATEKRRKKIADRKAVEEQATDEREAPVSVYVPEPILAAPARTPERVEGDDLDILLDVNDTKEDNNQAGAATPSPAAAPTPTMRHDNVIPFRAPTAPTIQETTVSTMNTEITGLVPAIEYAGQLAQTAEAHGQAGNEGYIAYLTSSEVKGDALATAYAMQESFSQAAAAAEAHRAALGAQLSVKEAYDSNPDAGDKEFLTGGL